MTTSYYLNVKYLFKLLKFMKHNKYSYLEPSFKKKSLKYNQRKLFSTYLNNFNIIKFKDLFYPDSKQHLQIPYPFTYSQVDSSSSKGGQSKADMSNCVFHLSPSRIN